MEAKDTLIVLVEELTKRGITVFGVGAMNDGLCYHINGFAKSGHGFLFIDDDGKIKLETKYDWIDVIESLEDIVNVAYAWDWNYCKQNDSKLTDYSVSPAWRKIYEEFGLNIDVFK